MATLKQKKILLASAILISLSGVNIWAAEPPEIAGNENGMSQSSMVNVKS